ncbi:MAG: hypothetical protein IPH72_17840 [Sandaracinaceae bacterium]|nr:hypothetical protein [Sandaracinaceae bacterium]
MVAEARLHATRDAHFSLASTRLPQVVHLDLGHEVPEARHARQHRTAHAQPVVRGASDAGLTRTPVSPAMSAAAKWKVAGSRAWRW